MHYAALNKLYLCKYMNTLLKNRLFRYFAIIVIMLASFSMSYAFPPDSLRTKWIGGKKFFLHKVLPKETWTSVARKYKISLADLQSANSGVSVLKYNQIIQVPATESNKDLPAESIDQEKAQIPSAQTKPSTSSKKGSKFHVVSKGETLYRISKENNVTVEQIKAWNNLSSNNVALGQRLKVGEDNKSIPKEEEKSPTNSIEQQPKKEAIKEIEKPVAVAKEKELVKPTPPAEVKTTPVKADTNTTLPEVYNNPGASRNSVIEKDPKSGATVEKITETGVANWMTDGELNQNKFYALHRTAPVGTIMKVTNRMNNNSVYVKVVGLLPDTGDNKNVMIKITQAAAQRIGALDQRFTAELSYGINK
jgi:LysM repeat protein